MKKLLFLPVAALLLTAGLAAFAQGAKPSPPAKAAPKVEKAFVCEMCDFAGDKPGKCPKCGMNLKEVNRADIAYTCEMCKVSQDKPGKCPKCGMALKLKVKAPAKPPEGKKAPPAANPSR